MKSTPTLTSTSNGPRRTRKITCCVKCCKATIRTTGIKKYLDVLSINCPPEGVSTLMLWEGLSGQMIPRAMPAVALLLVGQVKGDDSD